MEANLQMTAEKDSKSHYKPHFKTKFGEWNKYY